MSWIFAKSDSWPEQYRAVLYEMIKHMYSGNEEHLTDKKFADDVFRLASGILLEKQ